MRYRFETVYGDKYRDGHKQTEAFKAESNYPYDTIKQSFDKVCADNGLDFTEELLEHGEPYLSPEITQKLNAMNLKLDAWNPLGGEEFDEDGGLYVDGIEHITAICAALAKLELPDLEFRIGWSDNDSKEMPFAIGTCYALYGF